MSYGLTLFAIRAQEKEFKEAYPDAAGQGLSKKYAPALEFDFERE
jgi:hypothetical protein